MHKNPEDFSMQDAMRLANTPVGKELIATLRSTGGSDWEDVQQAVNNGDYESAKSSLSQILKSPKIQALLKEMEQNNG